MSFYRQQLEDWLKTLNVEAFRVFDVGGIQKPVKDRVKSWKVDDYQILDLPEFDLDKDYSIPDLQKIGQADIIFCLEVFEYLINPFQAMKNISRLLNPGGKAYISFPLCYPWHNETELDSLRYTETGIRRLAEKVNLKVKNITYRRTRLSGKNSMLTMYYAFDGMKAAKDKDHEITGYIVELEA